MTCLIGGFGATAARRARARGAAEGRPVEAGRRALRTQRPWTGEVLLQRENCCAPARPGHQEELSGRSRERARRAPGRERGRRDKLTGLCDVVSAAFVVRAFPTARTAASGSKGRS
jgi:hypothetical protein